MVAVGVASCPPPTLSGADLSSIHTLGGEVRGAGNPHDLAGAEVAALGVDAHRSVSFDLWLVYRVRGRASTLRRCQHLIVEGEELTGHSGGEVTGATATMDGEGEGVP